MHYNDDYVKNIVEKQKKSTENVFVVFPFVFLLGVKTELFLEMN